MKAGRQRRMLRLIRDRTITSQIQLVRLLRSAGFAATQATVSRDLDELGAVKVRRDGKVAYVMPTDLAGAPVGDAVREVLATSVTTLESTGNLVVVKTPPGHAQMVASAIDRGQIEGVAGTVAGDDTLLVVCKAQVPPGRVERRLRSLAGTIPGSRAD